MDKNKPETSKTNGALVKTEKDDDGNRSSNQTEPYNYNQFRSSLLTEKYSVHQNDAALEEDFRRILAGDSDNDLSGPPEKSYTYENGTNVSSLDKSPSKRRSMVSKDDYVLSWAESVRNQSISLSMVASVLTDHDYLSQENTLGIMNSNEEAATNESQLQKAKDQAEKVDGVEPNVAEDMPTDEINDLNSVVKLLIGAKSRKECFSLLTKIQNKTKLMKCHLGEMSSGDEEKDSSSEFNMPPNYSEPLEYYGISNFPSETTTDLSDQSDGECQRVKNSLKMVENVNRRINTDLKTIREKLSEIELIKEVDERNKNAKTLEANVGLMINSMVEELKSIASAFKSNDRMKTAEMDNLLVRASTSKQDPNAVSKSQSKERRIYDSDSESSVRSPNAQKKLRRRRKHRSDDNMLASELDSSDISMSDLRLAIKNEPTVHLQAIDDLMTGRSNDNMPKENNVRAPSADSSKDADNDDELMGFAEGSSEIEIGIKTELLQTLESEPTINGMQSECATFKVSAKQKESHNGLIDVKKGCDNLPIDKSAIVNGDANKDKKSSNIDDDMSSNEDELLSLAENGLSVSDEDDADIKKLCDFSSLGIRRQMPTSPKEKPNGVAEPVKKPTSKPPKEDELMKIMNQPDDIEQSEHNDSDVHSEHDERTEEQFLRERNKYLKEQLLQDTSEEDSFVESESDDDNFDSSKNSTNGKAESNSDTDDFEEDDKDTSESDESLMGKFLGIDEKPKSKEIRLGGETNERAAAIPSVRAIENGSDSDRDSDASDKIIKKKAKTAIGAKIFANLDKDDEIELSSDNDNESDDVKFKSRAHNNDKKSGDMLDTSMFRSQKNDIDPDRLSKKLLEDRAKKSSATPNDRVSPEEPIMLSSDEDDLELIPTGKNDEEEKGKRGPRKLLRDDQLADDTKQAQRDEHERIKRLDKKNTRLTQYLESQRISSQGSQEDVELVNENELILDYDSKKKEKIVVHSDITKHLKEHQHDGIKFMYDCCYGSVDNLEKFPGSGCILAHCMGLGKTLQLISLLNTVISYPQLKTDRILVICPKSTVMNWKEEIERWVNPIQGRRRRLKLFTFAEQSEIKQKISRLKEWYQCGASRLNPQAGVFLLGYEAFRVLVNYHDSKKGVGKYSAEDRDKIRDSVHKYLLNPGADLVVCDEGHIIKNQKSTTSLAVNRICTKRRIVLTGTPIQNNLKEYYAMVNFIKPSFLGTEKEFANLYATPIKNGQHKDSSKAEIKYMKQRSYVLHKKLSKFVQRREAALLKSFLPRKYEYVLFIPITKVQATLYQYFLDNNPNKVIMGGKSLIPDYTVLRKIWTHPKVLESAYKNAIAKNKPIPVINGNDSGDEPDDVLDTQTGLMSVTNNWWKHLLDENDLNKILPSYKLHVLFEILSKCRENGEKCLIFSAFVAVLDVVEHFMQEICKQTKENKIPGLETFVGPWEYGKDYYRLDGKTPKNRRHEMITSFNKPENKRTTAFLISAKAGGQGINLIGANRVILLDTSWNPSNDQQNIFRVFRLGQKKVCYIYRLLAMGTMEEKVYSRSVTKQAMSCRVIDEQQIDRHYNMAELTELYTLTIPKMEDRETPNYPHDGLLAHLLRNYPHMVYKYHEHDSLLENKNEQDLSEEEKAEAWKQYDDDVKRKNETNMGPYGNNIGMLPNYSNLGSYASSFYNNYNSLSGISGLNYPYNPYSQYSFGNDYNPLRFNDYAAFYNKLMSSPLNYNQSTSPNLLSPNHPTPVSSPSPHMNNFASSRNWMQSSASAASSSYGNSLLSSLAQTSPTHINSIMNNFYNTLGNGNTSNFSSLLPSTSGNQTAGGDVAHDFSDINAMASYLQQQQQLSSMAGTSETTSAGISTSNTASGSGSGSAQGPNAMRNPILTKELSITNRNPILDKFNNLLNSSIQTSVITKSTTTTSVVQSQSPITVTTVSAGSPSTATVNSTTNKTKSTEANVSSTNDKNGASKLTITEVNSLARKYSDTSASLAKKSIENANGSRVTSTVTDKSKQTTSIQKPPISTNMGIVYPASKSVAKSSVSISDRDQWLKMVNAPTTTKTGSETVANKTTTAQPQANIIRRSNFAGVSTSPGIASRNAVTTLTKNREITVTQTRGALPPVSNSITVSPICNTGPAPKKPHITNTPPQVVVSKVNSPIPSSRASNSAVPIALSKAPQPLILTTNSVNRVPAKQTVSPSRTNNPQQVSSSAKTLVSTTTLPRINGDPKMPAPRIVQGTTPMISKVQSLSVPSGNNNKPQSPTQLLTKVVPSVALKRPQTTMANIQPVKKPKLYLGQSSAPSTPRGNQTPKQGVLQGLRMASRPLPNQKTNSQILPVEIVELD